MLHFQAAKKRGNQVFNEYLQFPIARFPSRQLTPAKFLSAAFSSFKVLEKDDLECYWLVRAPVHVLWDDISQKHILLLYWVLLPNTLGKPLMHSNWDLINELKDNIGKSKSVWIVKTYKYFESKLLNDALHNERPK